ncbi:hypothetical protein [Streptomyces sp. NPDC002550]
MAHKSRTVLKRTKTQLQSTAWLPYIPPAVATAIFLVMAAMGQLIDFWQVPLFWLPAGIGIGLLATAAFDVITVKLGLRPNEAVPLRRDDLAAVEIMRSRRSCRSYQSGQLIDAHREQLGSRFDPERDHVICVCAVGYRSRFKPLTIRVVQRLQSGRLPLTSLFFADSRIQRHWPSMPRRSRCSGVPTRAANGRRRPSTDSPLAASPSPTRPDRP